jgi:hypothetical protein
MGLCFRKSKSIRLGQHLRLNTFRHRLRLSIAPFSVGLSRTRFWCNGDSFRRTTHLSLRSRARVPGSPDQFHGTGSIQFSSGPRGYAARLLLVLPAVLFGACLQAVGPDTTRRAQTTPSPTTEPPSNPSLTSGSLPGPTVRVEPPTGLAFGPEAAAKLSARKPQSAPSSGVALESRPDSASPKVEQRNWADNTGEFEVVAVFLGFEGELVSLLKADGSTRRVPIARLSKRDQEYLLDLLLLPNWSAQSASTATSK